MVAFSRTLSLPWLLLLILISSSGDMDRCGRGGCRADAAASSLAGTKIRLPWSAPGAEAPLGREYIATEYDLFDNERLTKLLDVGACTTRSSAFSYVPPLDGTNPDDMLCQEFYGMRFVLFDLQLANVDALSGSFTAQFQLVFHWTEGWEMRSNVSEDNALRFSYMGDPITTTDKASTCGFDCDSTTAVKTECCDRMWVPQLQVPSCQVNNVDSVLPRPYLRTVLRDNQSSFWHGWSDSDYYAGDFDSYTARRTWYVGLDVTCPFKPEFHNFPYDYQLLTVDIVNPYASYTWLQLNKGFLEANIVNSITGIDLSLSPDRNIDGWSIKDLIISSACGPTQQTWEPTFFTQDYLLQLLGDQ